MKAAVKAPMRFGIIHVGASRMSVSIFEYTSLVNLQLLERAERDVTFGEEVFRNHSLSFETIDEICRTLRGYVQLLKDYGISDYQVVGTAVVREAENRRNILDQIYVQTGLMMTVIDMPKEIYYKYFGLYYHLYQKGITQQRSDEAVLFLDITSGGVGISIWYKGSLKLQENIHLGSLRVLELFSRNQRASLSFPCAIHDYLHSMLAPLEDEMKAYPIRYLVLAGDEAQQLSGFMGYPVTNGQEQEVDVSVLTDFVESFHGVSVTKMVNRYHIQEHRANILVPTLLLYHVICQMAQPQIIVTSPLSLVDGISLYYGAERSHHPFLEIMREQNVRLAWSMARHYQIDEAYTKKIERFGLQFCKALEGHGVSARSLYLYRIAAVLSEVGKFVSLRNNSEHAYHIVMGSDIFGLTDDEKRVVANVVYYHYKGYPSDADAQFRELDEVDKRQIMKLVAIIRLAKDLDASYEQKIQSIDVTVLEQEKKLIVTVNTKQNVFLEQLTFMRDVGYFNSVFGLAVEWKRGGESK